MDLLTLEQRAIAQKLKDKGFTPFEVATAVEHWTSTLPSSFKFKTSFPGTDAHCKSTWGSRVFKHTDWVDGSSLVQAGETPNEEGFNARFHDIENDLDRLGASLDVAFDCVNELRATLAKVLVEISAQFDLVAAVIASCCSRMSTSGPTMTGTNGGSVLGTINLREDVEIIAFSTADGFVHFMPKGGPTPPAPRGGTGPYEAAASRVANLMRILTVVKDIPETMRGGVTKAALVKKFGDARVEGGPTLSEALDILPSNVSFKSLNAVVTALAEAESGLLKATRGADAVLTDAFHKSVENVESTPIENFAALPEQTRLALSNAGINTVGALAGATTAKITAALKAGGVDADAGEAGALAGAAKLMGFFD